MNPIQIKSQWNLSHIYSDEKSWKKDIQIAENFLKNWEEILGAKKDISNSPSTVRHILDTKNALYFGVEKIVGFALLNLQILQDDKASEFFMQAMELKKQLEERTQWILPKLYDLGAEKLNQYAADPHLQNYAVFLRSLAKEKAREAIHRLLIDEGITARFGKNHEAYQEFLKSFVFPPILDSKGESHLIDDPNEYYSLLFHTDRELRKAAFFVVAAESKDKEGVAEELLNEEFKLRFLLAQTWNCKTIQEMDFQQSQLPPCFDKNIALAMQQISLELPSYFGLKKQLLCLDPIHLYDLNLLKVSSEQVMIPYEEAKKIILDAFAPLGAEYQETLERALFKEQWVQIFEKNGHSSSIIWNHCDIHPYIATSYEGSIDDLLELGGLLGSAMHSHLSRKLDRESATSTPFSNQVAVNVARQLLFHQLTLKYSENKEIQLSILDRWAELIYRGFFEVGLNLEFDLQLQKIIEEGDSLKAEELNSKYLDSMKKYFPEDLVVIDSEVQSEWVSQGLLYDRSVSRGQLAPLGAANYFFQKIMDGDIEGIKNYITYLSSGRLNSPVILLKVAGCDFNEPEIFKKTGELFKNIVARLDEACHRV